MSDISYILFVFILMSLATYVTRLTPFVFFSQHHERSLLKFVAKYTPPMVMTILVMYMLKGVQYNSVEGLYYILALLVTVLFHLCIRNALLSIFAGTIVYMFAIQILP